MLVVNVFIVFFLFFFIVFFFRSCIAAVLTGVSWVIRVRVRIRVLELGFALVV